MVDEDLADTTLGDLQDGARDHGVAVEREHIVDNGALTERPALGDVSTGKVFGRYTRWLKSSEPWVDLVCPLHCNALLVEELMGSLAAALPLSRAATVSSDRKVALSVGTLAENIWPITARPSSTRGQ
jgi:hypothetical protein